MSKEEKPKEPVKKRSKKHKETKLAIKGSLEDVIKASFLKADKKTK
jgi:hypothetical protein